MKKYLLFAGKNDENKGGWDDFVNKYSDSKIAIDVGNVLIELQKADWFHIVNTRNNKIIYTNFGSD